MITNIIIFFRKGAATLKRLIETLEGKLNKEERRDLDELMDYLTTDGGAWALGTPHLETIGKCFIIFFKMLSIES